MNRRRALCLALAVLLGSNARGDSWLPAAVMGKASAGGEYVVRVTPGTSMGDVYGFGGMSKGPYATAEWFRFKGGSYEKVRSVAMANPIAPVEIEVTRRGTLIAIDNWHNLGVGNVVTFYSPEGRRVKALTLLDLYSSDDLSRIDRSSSSIHWRCEVSLSLALDERERVMVVDDSLGGRFTFQVDTGEFQYERSVGSCKR